jgi:hypothetical protein
VPTRYSVFPDCVTQSNPKVWCLGFLLLFSVCCYAFFDQFLHWNSEFTAINLAILVYNSCLGCLTVVLHHHPSLICSSPPAPITKLHLGTKASITTSPNLDYKMFTCLVHAKKPSIQKPTVEHTRTSSTCLTFQIQSHPQPQVSITDTGPQRDLNRDDRGTLNPLFEWHHHYQPYLLHQQP